MYSIGEVGKIEFVPHHPLAGRGTSLLWPKETGGKKIKQYGQRGKKGHASGVQKLKKGGEGEGII